MATVIKLKILVDELDNVLGSFNRVKVYRSTTGINGTYSELTDATTRIPLEAGKTLYEYDDLAGDISYWYKTSYYHDQTLLESNKSDGQLGDDPSLANIITVQEVKDLFLFGVKLTNDGGTPYPDIMFEWGIRQAIARVERELDIILRPTSITERYDYYNEDYQNWTFIRLRQAPVISVESVAVKWPSNQTVINFPEEWIQLRKDAGQVNIVPTAGTLSQVLLTAGGSFLPLVASGRDFVPDILEVSYTAGFAAGELPYDLKDLVGKFASFGPLNIAGDLIGGAGIASKSISLDGLSQSVNTTSSPQNAGYSARLIRYDKEIKQMLPVLRRHYKGMRMAAL